MITRRDRAHFAADLFDDTGGLVPEHRGKRIGIEPFYEMKV